MNYINLIGVDEVGYNNCAVCAHGGLNFSCAYWDDATEKFKIFIIAITILCEDTDEIKIPWAL